MGFTTAGYPDDKALKKIEKWQFETWDDIVQCLDFVCDHWKYTDVGWVDVQTKYGIRLEVHTFGWSGNEELMGALRRNLMFWCLFWQKSTRGGHYWFKFERRTFVNKSICNTPMIETGGE